MLKDLLSKETKSSSPSFSSGPEMSGWMSLLSTCRLRLCRLGLVAVCVKGRKCASSFKDAFNEDLFARLAPVLLRMICLRRSAKLVCAQFALAETYSVWVFSWQELGESSLGIVLDASCELRRL